MLSLSSRNIQDDQRQGKSGIPFLNPGKWAFLEKIREKSGNFIINESGKKSGNFVIEFCYILIFLKKIARAFGAHILQKCFQIFACVVDVRNPT